MLRKGLMLLGAGLVLNSTGCALFSLLMLPVEFVMSILGFVWEGVDNAIDAIVHVQPAEGPAPVVESLGDGRFLVAGIEPGARFDLLCEAPGAAPRRFSFPADAGALVIGPDGRAELPVRLVPEGGR